VSLQSSFNRFVKSLQEFLTGYGFVREGGRVFRKVSPDGDVLIIELQTSDASTKSERLFFINVALTLAPCWEFDRQRYGLAESALPTSMYGMWRHRIGFTGFSGSDRWRITDDASSAAVWAEVRRRLEETLPELLQLLDRNRLRELAERKEFIGYASWLVLAWLLAEEGPSAELEDLLFAQRPKHTRNSPMTKGIIDYANRKASAGSREG